MEALKDNNLTQTESKDQHLETELKKATEAVRQTPRHAAAIILKTIDNCNAKKNSDAIKMICDWLIDLLLQYKAIEWDDISFKALLSWLGALLSIKTSTAVQISALLAITTFIKHQPQNSSIALQLFHRKQSNMVRDLKASADNGTVSEEPLYAMVQCLDMIATGMSSISAERNAEHIEILEDVGTLILQLHFITRPSFKEPTSYAIFLLSTLSLITKISVLCTEFAQYHASELFGLSYSYMTVGLEKDQMPVMQPQKILPSQHAAYIDDVEGSLSGNVRAQGRKNNGGGGKVSKSRKPRVVRNKPNDVQKVSSAITPCLGFDLKTSDSDVSEPEIAGAGHACSTSTSNLQVRSRNTKIRVLCISLVGITASALDRRTLYSYWNALFSGSSGDHMEPPPVLLSVSIRDPAWRCRCASLQTVAQLLYTLRGLLEQAESPNTLRTSLSFLTFANNLALSIDAMYTSLTKILQTESSLSVLTQALKCLAVLVQATPFHKLESNIIATFTPHVRTFVYHRDYTIQLSALMVMEFLVAKSEFTSEIAMAIGVPPLATSLTTRKQQQCHLRIKNSDLLVDKDEEVLEEDAYGEERTDDVGKVDAATEILNNTANNFVPTQKTLSSWLIARVLQQLDCVSNGSHCFASPLPSSLRIECLQILATMAMHITLLLPQLPQISRSLCAALCDTLQDVCVCAARCLDSIAYEISCYLQTNDGILATSDIEMCETFWTLLLPVIVEHVSTSETFVVEKVSLCDALSNIGVVVYERLPRGVQLQQVILLYGVSRSAGMHVEGEEDVLVSAAAVRAMAVFALFPSLREDLVFLENTAESILRLMGDANMLVRIKAVWALGNITDALIINEGCNDSNGGCFSNELLNRLIRATLKACDDNDKVRSNAVRALGNLLRLILPNLSDDDASRSLFECAIQKLSDCIRITTGSAKVKWNCCYAIGNLLRYKAFYINGNNSMKKTTTTSLQLLYNALCHVIVHHANFKVRINAVVAIANIESREHFGSHFNQFWSALLGGIEQSVQLEHYSEYNHRDKLQEQLCLTMCHLISCAQEDDLLRMRNELRPHVEVVHNTWLRVVNRLVPEQAATMLACSVKLQNHFKNCTKLTTEQQAAIAFIADTFYC